MDKMIQLLIIVAAAISIHFVMLVVTRELYKRSKCNEWYHLVWGR